MAEVQKTLITKPYLESQLSNKANIDGSYDDLTAGSAEQLISNVFVEDSVPYNFRTSGGSADIGDREYDTVVGGTVAWNQLQANTKSYTTQGTTYTYSNGKLTVKTEDGGATANNWWLTQNDIKWDWIKDHVYLIDIGNSEYSFTAGLAVRWYLPAPTGYSSINIPKARSIIKPGFSTNVYLQYVVYSGLEVDETYKPQVFDLTQMFGSTIADYIYSLEQATAGAGVAWFKKLFPKDYYAYDAGSLQSVQAKSHDTVGFNAWDEEVESGTLSATGTNVVNSSRIRSKNYIPVVPGATYYSKCPGGNYFWGYDANKTYVGRVPNTNKVTGTFTVPDNVYYVRFSPPADYGTTYNHDICLNLSWDGERDGEYEPYVKHEYALDPDLTLRGIPKLDSNNQLYYDGDEYESDGTVTRRYGIVDLGTLTWTRTNDGQEPPIYAFTSSGFDALGLKSRTQNDPATGIVSKDYSFIKTAFITNMTADMTWMVSTNGRGYFRNDSCETKEAFKSAVSGVYLVYELATPTTESADPYTNPQIVDDFGTEEYVDAGVTASTPTRDVAIPVGHETNYLNNLKAKLEMAPESPSGDGDYIVRQSNGTNTYVQLVIPDELPSDPTEDGTYLLKCTVADGTATLSWESET